MTEIEKKVTKFPNASGPTMDINDRIGAARAMVMRSASEELAHLEQQYHQTSNPGLLAVIGDIKAATMRHAEELTTQILVAAGVKFTGEITVTRTKQTQVEPPGETNEDPEEEAQAAADLAAWREQQRKEQN